MSGTSDIILKTITFSKPFCNRGGWLVLLHARRVPPHVGLLINGNYNSLTVKGAELDVSFASLLKMINQKKVEAVFIKLIDHPVFSVDYQLEVFQELIKKHRIVKQFEATCLTPIKDFFQEFYAIDLQEEELLPFFLTRLNLNGFLETATSFNFELDENLLKIPLYDTAQLHEKIKTERLPFYTDN